MLWINDNTKKNKCCIKYNKVIFHNNNKINLTVIYATCDIIHGINFIMTELLYFSTFKIINYSSMFIVINKGHLR